MALEHSRKVGRIYAAALFELAKADNSVGRVGKELQELEQLYDGNDEFRRFFTSPRLERKAKTAALQEMFSKLDRKTLNLLCVLVHKGRETAFDNVVDAFERYRDEAEDRVHAYVRSAVALDDATRESIRKQLSSHAKEIVLHETVDDDLIGGLVIKVHDWIVDNTIRTRLRELRREMLPYTGFAV